MQGWEFRHPGLSQSLKFSSPIVFLARRAASSGAGPGTSSVPAEGTDRAYQNVRERDDRA